MLAADGPYIKGSERKQLERLLYDGLDGRLAITITRFLKIRV